MSARWLDAYTTSSGLPDPRLAGTAAKPRHCSDCGRLVLAGYDAPVCAHLAVVDPYRATAQLETAAVLTGRATYHLRGVPGDYQLTPRHFPGVLPIVPYRRADECVVVITHSCDLPALSTIPLPTQSEKHAIPADAAPPF